MTPWPTADVFLVIVGLVAIATALTGGRFGVFRPDLSLVGAADCSASWPWSWSPGSSSLRRAIGAFVALIGAMAVAGGAGDYATLRGAPPFPKTAAGADPPAR